MYYMTDPEVEESPEAPEQRRTMPKTILCDDIRHGPLYPDRRFEVADQRQTVLMPTSRPLLPSSADAGFADYLPIARMGVTTWPTSTGGLICR